ncbi:MAG: c-type cytochrome biogenesis protein CcmI [Burkholderiales bacterium]
MTAFIATVIVMAAVAVAWVLPALLRNRNIRGVQARASNLDILRDQRAELEADIAADTLSSGQYRQAREDLERRALAEARETQVESGTQPSRARVTAIVLAVAIPLAAGALYMQFGTPGALSPQPDAPAAKFTPQEVEAMVAKLAARLEQKPDDGNGWALLARTYLVMQRPKEAVAAYERATAILKDNADLLADYADALALLQDRHIDGRSLQMVERALKVDPTQWKALAMAGSAAFERKDYKKAVAYWEKLQSRAEPGSEFAREIVANIDEARVLGGIKVAAGADPKPAAGAASSAAASVEGSVTLSAKFAGKAAPTDTVFVFARAAQGPRMPLAVMRVQVKDLPAKFHLDDSLAMSPEMKLSRFSDVVIGARISKSANATPQSGDFTGMSKPVKVGDKNVAVVIDSVVQ